MNPLRFQHKTVLVTGATSGIGRTTALAFGREGARVAVAGRRAEEGEETVKQITAAGGTARFIRTDVTRPDEVERLVKETVAAFGGLHCAFNNAGVAEAPLPFIDQPEDAYDRVMDTTVKGLWLCLKAEIRHMLQHGGGAIVNMSSIAGLVGTAAAPIYAASKHAVLGLTKSTALEYAKSGIRINAVCPGAIETAALQGYFESQPEVKQHLIAGHPIGRLGQPEEVAQAVLWLCSGEAAFLAGHALQLDGGYTAQ